jgi:dTDP-glucose 4,6-dehydratase
MRVVVTGGAGFIGSNLLHYWARQHPDDELVTLDLLTYAGHRSSIEDLERQGRLQFVLGSVADPGVADRTFRGADLVLHLAAESHVDRSIADPAPFLTTNVLGTYTVLESARRLDVPRVHVVGTDEVFGSLPLDEPRARFTSRTPYAPRNPYSASKAASDHLARSYHATYGLPVTLSNCGNNYGPYQHPEKLIPLAITRLLAGEKVPVYGDGKNVRDWIYVEDHCAALDAIYRLGKPGETYLLGAGEERSNLEVVRDLLRLMKAPPDRVRFVPDRPGHDRRYAIDARAAMKALGWRPAVRWEEGLSRTVDWYRSHRSWWEPLVPKVPSEAARLSGAPLARPRGSA